MLNDKLSLTGALTISVNGEVVRDIKNLVVTSGKELVAQNLQGGSVVPVTHMGVGTGSTAAAVGDAALEAELDRNALTTSGGTHSGAQVSYECTWLAGDGTGAITEAGLFTADTGGTMLARTVFPVVNKGADDTITIAWTVTIS
jgi:hypothetical protein